MAEFLAGEIVMKIAITGGKGGTGKSTVATALAVELAKENRVLLVDADVDCPNDHLILSIKRREVKRVEQTVPKWDFKKCVKCGKCSAVCKANSIVFVKGRFPIFIPDQCNGCGACIISCPKNAISESKKEIGKIFSGKKQKLDFVSGELFPNQPIAEFVVSAIRDYVNEIENKYDFVLIDTSAGTHCDVISALLGCDMALAVTEPTPLGAHDMELILELLKILKIPAKIVLNRSDIGDESLIKKIAEKYGTEIIGDIPYKKEIMESYSKGEPVIDDSILKIVNYLKKHTQLT